MNKYNNGASKLENNHKYYYILKKFKYIFLSKFDTLSDQLFYNKNLHGWYNKHSIIKIILDIDPKIKLAYELYSKYLEFNKTLSFEEASKEIKYLLDDFFCLGIKQFEDIVKTISHWKEYVLNSFIKVDSINETTKRRLSNSPIEGISSIVE